MKIIGNIFLGVLLVVLTILIILLCILAIYKFICYLISEKYDIAAWSEYYEKLYEKRVKQIEDEYKHKLESKSKEYFKEFYDEAMKKKEDTNVQ